MTIRLFVGTDKGAFTYRSDDRRSWTLEGPAFKGWKVTTSARRPGGGWVAATASDVYGAAIHRSDDLRGWTQVRESPTWPKDGGRKMRQVWTIAAAGPRLLAGVDDAGLFASDDDGDTWLPVVALNEHPTRGAWYPGAGGLCLHAILVDPEDPRRIWAGISAVGVFRTDDGGATWRTANEGVRAVIEDPSHADIGRCVHGLVADPDDANVIWRREHVGMFRSRDGGDSWERIEEGLSSWFGFPIAIDRRTRALYVVPLESDEYRLTPEGRLRVYRSRDGGDHWEPLERGLPQSDTWTGVLRGAMDVDGLDPGGVYFGTTSGTVHASADGGDSWTRLPGLLPRILHVAAYAEG